MNNRVYKIRLFIELVAYTKPLEESDGSEIYIEVVQDMEIPFKPKVGALIPLPLIPKAHADFERYQELVARAPERAQGICPVGSVMRDKERNVFYVRGDYPNNSYMSPEAVELIAQQLIVGYGFRRNDY